MRSSDSSGGPAPRPKSVAQSSMADGDGGREAGDEDGDGGGDD